MLNRKKSKGQSLVEYALILALISVVCVGTLGQIGTAINTKLSTEILPKLQ